MWKLIFKLIGKLLLLIIPFFVLLPLYCAHFQEYYLDDEYAMYHAQRDYLLNSNEKNKVIIIGDSRTKAGFLPKELSEDTYNLALGGASPIEGYYSLKEYLANHEKPETVIIAFAPMHYMDVDTLWTRTIYFHNISNQDAKELFESAKKFSCTDKIIPKDYGFDYLCYRYYMPNKYATALKNAGFVFRHKQTTAKYEEMMLEKGHSYYGLADSSDGIDGEAKVSDFVASDIITDYMNRMIALCVDNGIHVIVETAPVNETSYSIFTDAFKTHYREYMTNMQKSNPMAEIYTDFYCWGNDQFGDADHLNERGSKAYSAFIKEKYTQVFTK